MSSIINYNPDVLDALANLSNDEVFTPPKVANQMLDTLPAELWSDKNATFLDPATKSGVFLREIAKRLIEGLEKEIPDLQERLNHIYTKQLFGIAITELTVLLSRRSLYCSKYANSKYSIPTAFNNQEGNIVFNKILHTWKNGRCEMCGASKDIYDRDESLETHAYEFIHRKPEEILKLFNTQNMKFDVIIGNPPYQLDTGGGSAQATPLYNLFVEQAKKMGARYISMIIPSRWFSGGMGLSNFRKTMMEDRRLKEIVDFVNAKDCFPGVSIGGGVNYFLWDRDYNGICKITNINGKNKDTMARYLNEFPVIIRNNKSVSIIHKVQSEPTIESIVSSISPFGIPTYVRGTKEVNQFVLHSSEGTGYIGKEAVKSGFKYFKKYKVLLSANTSEHAGEPSKDGVYKVFASMKVLTPIDICTHSYILIGMFDSEEEAQNLQSYLKTKFVRFLVLQTISGISISKEKFRFVPLQDFSEPWTDEKLYKKYNLTKEEIGFIESMIRPMD